MCEHSTDGKYGNGDGDGDGDGDEDGDEDGHVDVELHTGRMWDGRTYQKSPMVRGALSEVVPMI